MTKAEKHKDRLNRAYDLAQATPLEEWSLGPPNTDLFMGNINTTFEPLIIAVLFESGRILVATALGFVRHRMSKMVADPRYGRPAAHIVVEGSLDEGG